MPVIIIPFDYDPQKDEEVPIYLKDTDVDGERIFFGWIEAVVPIQEKLRSLSRRILQDVWRVSELTEITIHHLWRVHRENVGPDPSFRIYKTAHKNAHRLEDPGARVHCKLNFSLDCLDEYQKDALVGEDADIEGELHRHLDLQRMEGKMRELATRNELELYRLVTAGYRWREIGPKVGEHPNTVFRRFRRLVQRIADVV
jgi:hypothetical protein